MKVKLLESFGTRGSAGDTIEVTKGEKNRMVASGQAVVVEEAKTTSMSSKGMSSKGKSPKVHKKKKK